MTDFDKLKAEFPREAISWRAQTVTEYNGKTTAMALAYIDARDVMNRLDDAVGIERWQCRYSHAEGKTVCDIGIKIKDEWIWKADGAGDTDVEQEKGACSDAFKRAAVRWGIGRYLYNLPTIWVPCEAYKDSSGKLKFRKFTDDPWKLADKAIPFKKAFTNDSLRKKFHANIIESFDRAFSINELKDILDLNEVKLAEMKESSEHDRIAYDDIVNQYKFYKKRFTDRQQIVDGFGQGFADAGEIPSDRWRNADAEFPEEIKP